MIGEGRYTKFENVGCLKAKYTKVENVAQTQLECKHRVGRNVGRLTVAVSQGLLQGRAHGRCLVLTGRMNCLCFGNLVAPWHVLSCILITVFYFEIESFLKADVKFSFL